MSQNKLKAIPAKELDQYNVIRKDQQNLHATHFELGAYKPSAFYNTTYLVDYQVYPFGSNARLSEEQRDDLRKHHFQLGTLQGFSLTRAQESTAL